MDKLEIVNKIKNDKIIAIIRSDESNNLDQISKVLIDSGIHIFEIAFNTPGALSWIEKISKKFKEEAIIGAGTIIDSETAVQAINVGAKFIVSPIFKSSIVRTCLRYNVVSIPGAFTCKEALEAHECGADFIKIFPADFLGPDYIKAIKTPFPQFSIIPVGGINLLNAKAFLESGADAIGIGGSLVSKVDIIENNFDSIKQKARDFIMSISC